MSTTAVTLRNRTNWDIDLAHSSIRFSVKHLNISTVHGRFGRWTGDLLLDADSLERSHATIRIEAASIDTHEPKRDAHLRSVDFFDAEKYPTITFRSTRIERTSDNGFHLAGDLTIANVTSPVSLDAERLGQVKDPWGAERVVFEASTTIDRRNFGLVWSQVLETGGLLVGEKVKVEISIEAVRHPEPKTSEARP